MMQWLVEAAVARPSKPLVIVKDCSCPWLCMHLHLLTSELENQEMCDQENARWQQHRQNFGD